MYVHTYSYIHTHTHTHISTFLLLFDNIPSQELIKKSRYLPMCEQGQCDEYFVNRLTPNDPYMGRTAPLTSKRCILYIYSTNIGTELFIK